MKKVGKAVQEMIENDINKKLALHGGKAVLQKIENQVVFIELQGACAGCPAADMETKQWIEESMKREIPEIEKVEIVHSVSEELLDFARKILKTGTK